MMNKVALCIYTDDPEYKLENINGNFDIFFSNHVDKIYALKKVSVLKRLQELEKNFEYDICIGYNPKEASLDDISIDYRSDIEEHKIYYAYGYFDSRRFVVGAKPSLFYSKSLEFNRACEFFDNIKNIHSTREKTIEEKFLYHIRSLFLKDECVNYEDSSLFIRTAKID